MSSADEVLSFWTSGFHRAHLGSFGVLVLLAHHLELLGRDGLGAQRSMVACESWSGPPAPPGPVADEAGHQGVGARRRGQGVETVGLVAVPFISSFAYRVGADGCSRRVASFRVAAHPYGAAVELARWPGKGQGMERKRRMA